MHPRSAYLMALVLPGLQTGRATVTKSANQPVTVDTRPAQNARSNGKAKDLR